MTVRSEAGSTALTFQFDWNEAEHVRMLREVNRHRPADPFRRAVLVAWLLGSVALLASNRHPLAVLRGAAPWLALLAATVFVLSWLEPYIRARAYRLVNLVARHPLQRIISVHGLRTEPTHNSDIPWNEIRAVVETPEFFFFYIKRPVSVFFAWPYPAIQLPRRAILIPDDLKRLRGVLREQLGERARLLG